MKIPIEQLLWKSIKQKWINGNMTFDYAEAHWDDEPRYPNGDCMNYLSSVASNNGLPQSEEWKPGSKAWKGTKNNYSYMTNANGITNVAFAGEIPFANSEEAKEVFSYFENHPFKYCGYVEQYSFD